jgi:N-acetylglucosaminyldiphosphoundecaprenol N-acetyl-beta-D-mannosaminyltransferase
MSSLDVSSAGANETSRLVSAKISRSVVPNLPAMVDLSRNVHCVLGLPIDLLDLPRALDRIRLAASEVSPFLLSTPNLNFLVNSRTDPAFRESVQVSDLCLPDGMPIVWIAKLLGIPIKERVAGSDVFDELRSDISGRGRLRVFLFGGQEGLAAAVAAKLNAEEGGLQSVGAISPGFGSIEEMSSDEIIDTISSSGAQFLVVSLGVKKGQAWLLHNHVTLQVPVRVHLGAVINFQMGIVKRAPLFMRKLGLEWLWRIKEEPYLWSRYAHDGLALIGLLVTRVLPLALANQWQRLRTWYRPGTLGSTATEQGDVFTIKFSGSATIDNIVRVQTCFENAVASGKTVVLDLSDVRFVDSRFLGLLLMLRKQLRANEAGFELKGVKGLIAQLLRWNGLEWLLAEAESADPDRTAAKRSCKNPSEAQPVNACARVAS